MQTNICWGAREGKLPSLQSLKTVGVLCAYPALQGTHLRGRCTAIMPNNPLEYFYFLSWIPVEMINTTAHPTYFPTVWQLGFLSI